MPARIVDVRRFHGAEIAPYVSDLARLRIAVFRDFPYLYDGSLAYEERYLQTYLSAPRSVAVLAFDGDDVIGASTGIPLEDETPDFQAPFAVSGHAVAEIFYCGESVLNAAYRGRGIYRQFFEGRERHAKDLGSFVTSAFCAVERSADHVLRPPGYEPLDDVWAHFGYVRHPELTTTFEWKDVDCRTETEKTMVFWLKDLRS
ncbi:MAG: GNAT family N-acetyltransferase [Candidatus Eremiobacteraeota bacterium]|nr:GNAT family N-acetyltransferase [Candidatus Eremiobacteraeota bacterium]